MTKAHEDAIAISEREARRYLDAIDVWRLCRRRVEAYRRDRAIKNPGHEYSDPCHAAMLRASMDLTRSLTAVRRG